MPKADLPKKLEQLESNLVDAMWEGHKSWRPDLPGPQSSSDMEACVREVMAQFHIVKRKKLIDLFTGKPIKGKLVFQPD